ncbi:MAG: AraC family transcriptional regulator [Lentisphaeria bacterium]|nr:AraC family transcriptional regulator [Lentisphaeria bacterium]
MNHTNMTVSEIAEECGYESVSAFSKAFRLQNGIGPREYRSCMARSSCLASNTQKSGR